MRSGDLLVSPVLVCLRSPVWFELASVNIDFVRCLFSTCFTIIIIIIKDKAIG